MKTIKRFLAIALLSVMAACATQTLNDQEAVAIATATAGLRTSTALMQSGKITVAQNEANRKKFDAIIAGIKDARAKSDPVTIATEQKKAEALTAEIAK